MNKIRRNVLIGGIVVVLLLTATVVWTYLSTITELPALGFGLSINRWVLFGVLVVLIAIFGFWFFSLPKSDEG